MQAPLKNDIINGHLLLKRHLNGMTVKKNDVHFGGNLGNKLQFVNFSNVKVEIYKSCGSFL